jgi:hypothetical protein
MSRSFKACFFFVTLAFCPGNRVVAVAAPGFDNTAQTFIDSHCLSCHGEKKAKAGFRIDKIGSDFFAPRAAEQWQEVLDHINSGEMPPDSEPRPDAKQLTAFVDAVNAELRAVELASKNAGGRIPMRRLNRDEFANTVRDLLKVDENIVRGLAEELPGDGKAEGFDRLGVALFFDQTQIERSLAVASNIAAKAIVAEPPKQEKIVNAFGFLRLKPPSDMVEVFPGFTHKIPRGARDRTVQPDFIEHVQGYRVDRPGYRHWGAIDHFAVSNVVKQDGYYRVRINARVDNRARTEPNRFLLLYATDSPIEVLQEVEMDPSGVTEVMMFLRGPVNGEVKGQQVLRMWWNHQGKVIVTEPKYQELFSRWTGLRGKMEQAATRRAPEAEMNALKAARAELEKEMNAWTGPANIINPEVDIEKVPRLQIKSIEIEGPVQKDWPPLSHQALAFDETKTDAESLRSMFAKFLPRAYRRPVSPEEIEDIVGVVTASLEKGKTIHDAMRDGIQRILCAPGFQFLQEPALEKRPVTDHELASRLSYFLWSTMPDDELFDLAAKGQLRDAKTLAAQVKRMIADPKSGELVKNFGGQWLAVRDYGSIQPAADYRDYDKLLEAASKVEPLAFFTEILSKDLPITNFLDSDFLMINERLAKHYGIEGVTGDQFRRVAITPENRRGGVLGMTGLMTLLADGTRTLPMRRGSWVLKELLNDPPNDPPPNAGEIQPNTGGKNLTVRERLEKHRSDEVCASCHSKLDPFGLALENYDAIGMWRERFNGEGYRGNNGPVLDVSGEFPNGAKFVSLGEYKAGLMERKDQFARAFATKLLTYALGRPVGFTDREVIDSVTVELKKNDYRIQTLIGAIVESEPFGEK